MKADITSILRLSDWAGRFVLAMYAIGTTIVASFNNANHIVPLIDLLAIVLFWIPIVVLARRDTEPFSTRSTAIVVIAVCVISGLESWNVADPDNLGYATWYRGAMTFIMLVLGLRGRLGSAWFGFTLFGMISIIGGVISPLDPFTATYDVLRQSGTLLIGTLFALALQRSSRTITAIQNSQLSRAANAAAMSAAMREGAAQTQRLESGARPALERILNGTPLTSDDIAEFNLLEGTLRDGIRATGLSSDRVSAETRRARARGIRVILLDDRGDELRPSDLERVELALIEQLSGTRSGSITARLSPQDRDEIATILVEEDGGYRRVVVTADSVEATKF
jgi:hypothetical protein